jgi:hypothetical protein
MFESLRSESQTAYPRNHRPAGTKTAIPGIRYEGSSASCESSLTNVKSFESCDISIFSFIQDTRHRAYRKIYGGIRPAIAIALILLSMIH